MRNVAMTVGFDGAGDACVYFNIHDEDGNHIRYATENEIERYLCKLSEAAAEPTLEDLGVEDEEAEVADKPAIDEDEEDENNA